MGNFEQRGLPGDLQICVNNFNGERADHLGDLIRLLQAVVPVSDVMDFTPVHGGEEEFPVAGCGLSEELLDFLVAGFFLEVRGERKGIEDVRKKLN